MSDLRRIDPQAIPELFRRLDFLPIANDWAGENYYCLGLVLVGESEPDPMIGRSRVIRIEMEMRIEEELHRAKIDGYHADLIGIPCRETGLDREYLSGLINGWDDFAWMSAIRIDVSLPDADLEEQRYYEGWIDGRSAALACGVEVQPVTVL